MRAGVEGKVQDIGVQVAPAPPGAHLASGGGGGGEHEKEEEEGAAEVSRWSRS